MDEGFKCDPRLSVLYPMTEIEKFHHFQEWFHFYANSQQQKSSVQEMRMWVGEKWEWMFRWRRPRFQWKTLHWIILRWKFRCYNLKKT